MSTILVVDDDPGLRRLLQMTLNLYGFVVQLAESGEAALASTEEHAPDLVLLDLRMPGMGGRECFQHMRQAGYLMPVVVFSAFGAQSACAEMGAQASMTKPFDPDDLVETIQALLYSTSIVSA